MNIREQLEALEEATLSPYASLSKNTRGRDREEPLCDIRPAYQRDRDRILHCKAFRRLKHKTQVFLSPVGDHYRTRLTHTLEVAQIARTISKSLRLNEELTEAIALGHDLGHTPFGHAGEDALNSVCSEGFAHYKQSVRVVERLEKNGKGLNLTWEVRDGIRNHRTSGTPHTLEGKVVRLSDKIAYINHDIDDAIRAGILTEEMIPEEYTQVLGHTVRERLNTLVHSIIENSQGKPEILMAPTVEEAMKNLRAFMFKQVYTNSASKKRIQKHSSFSSTSITTTWIMWTSCRRNTGCSWRRAIPGSGWSVIYIAGMSDGYAIDKFTELFVPKAWKN